MANRSVRAKKRCPTCGFWLETVSETHSASHGATLSAVGSIPILGNFLALLLLGNDLSQSSNGPFWCWRCKKQVRAVEISTHAP